MKIFFIIMKKMQFRVSSRIYIKIINEFTMICIDIKFKQSGLNYINLLKTACNFRGTLIILNYQYKILGL